MTHGKIKMAKLNEIQIEEIKSYPAFKNYDTKQMEKLDNLLIKTDLNFAQMNLLFAEDYGLINNLVEASHEDSECAKKLGQIIVNADISIDPTLGLGLTPIIKNMVGKLGSYSQSIVDDVIELVRNHVEIYKAIIIPHQNNPLPIHQQQNSFALFQPATVENNEGMPHRAYTRFTPSHLRNNISTWTRIEEPGSSLAEVEGGIKLEAEFSFNIKWFCIQKMLPSQSIVIGEQYFFIRFFPHLGGHETPENTWYELENRGLAGSDPSRYYFTDDYSLDAYVSATTLTQILPTLLDTIESLEGPGRVSASNRTMREEIMNALSLDYTPPQLV